MSQRSVYPYRFRLNGVVYTWNKSTIVAQDMRLLPNPDIGEALIPSHARIVMIGRGGYRSVIAEDVPIHLEVGMSFVSEV